MSLPGKYYRNLGIFLLIMFMGAFLILLLWVGRHHCHFLSLNIYQVDQQKQSLVSTSPVIAGEKVILRYIHSSDGTPVEQIFKISEENTLALLEERYRWYGAGLEFSADYIFTNQDGWVSVSGYDRHFSALPIRVAVTVPQALILADTTKIILSDLAPPAARLLIKVEPFRLPWYRFFLINVLLHFFNKELINPRCKCDKF